MSEFIENYIKESISVKSNLLSDEDFISCLETVSEVIVKAFNNGGKLLIAGNGGSAGDSQHFAGELIAKFNFVRDALPAIALTVDSSIITAISNDIGYKYIFSRQIEALGRKNDIFFAISTSGNSENIIEAVKSAKSKNMLVVALTGKSISHLDNICDYILKVPSLSTPVIQESHLMIEHILCSLIERRLFEPSSQQVL